MWWLILIVNLIQCRVICIKLIICIKESPSERLSRSGQPVCLSIGNCLHNIDRGGTTCPLWPEPLLGFEPWTVSEERGCADSTHMCIALCARLWIWCNQFLPWPPHHEVLRPRTASRINSFSLNVFFSKIFYFSNGNETRTLATKSFRLAEL